jgi:uncharacterized membrane protein YkoI
MKTTVVAGAVFAALAAPMAQAADHEEVSLEHCLKAANAIRPGEFAKVEYLSVTDEHAAAYEIEVVTANGDVWEFECDTHHGRIVEMEREVASASDPLFAAGMKITEAQARATALKLYPGTVDEVEYEIEVNGEATYEIDVIDEYGVEFKVEINAGTGAIDEVQIESWEIGIEDKQ